MKSKGWLLFHRFVTIHSFFPSLPLIDARPMPCLAFFSRSPTAFVASHLGEGLALLTARQSRRQLQI
jgi:hypothetical protein